uniref:Uncharacterized protein n=1 Tax=Panagrolaimus davidi TaxID=227884 RepID=A0A914QV55_9BILA
MLGQFFAYSGGQIAYSAGWVSYEFLNDFSFGAEIFALGIALVCPSVKRKVLENDAEPNSNSTDSVVIADETRFPEKPSDSTEDVIVVNEFEAIAPAIVEIPEKRGGFMEEMKKSLPKIMSNRVVITWSLWWILTSGMISQVNLASLTK